MSSFQDSDFDGAIDGWEGNSDFTDPLVANLLQEDNAANAKNQQVADNMAAQQQGAAAQRNAAPAPPRLGSR